MVRGPSLGSPAASSRAPSPGATGAPGGSRERSIPMRRQATSLPELGLGTARFVTAVVLLTPRAGVAQEA
jgi:hypothetical protein